MSFELIPAGWGFVDGSSLGLVRADDGLPDLPDGPWIPEKRVQVIAALVEQPELVETLRPIDLCRRYASLPMNRAWEMLRFARAGRVPGRQGTTLQWANRRAAA